MEELQGTLWEPEWSITSHQEDLNCRNAREKRKKKRLCYYCNEKYEPDHKCKRKQIFLLDGDESEEKATCEVENDIKEDDLVVSLNAISGSTSHQTMRIRGNIKRKALTILIDSGSTHNFLDPIVAKRTGCLIQTTNPLKVAVADGTKITSDAICRQLTWNMQEKEFQADLRLIPLVGCNMVLGIQWLVELGPILWDFKNLRMEFMVKGRKFMLRGATTSPIKLVSGKQIQKDLRQISYASTTQIFSIQVEEEKIVKKQGKEPEGLAQLLQQYMMVFLEPQGLPP